MALLRTLLQVCFIGLTGLFALGTGNAIAATGPAVEDFFRKPTMVKPLMSPSGKYIAALMSVGGEKRLRLVVLNADDLSKPRVVAGFSDADITEVHWVNDERLIFSANDEQSPYATKQGAGLYAVDREGKSAVRRLIKRSWSRVSEAGVIDRELSALHRFFSTLSDGSDDIIVARYTLDNLHEFKSMALLRLDTRTGLSKILTQGAPQGAMHWVVDAKGNPRVVMSEHEGKARLYWKPKPQEEWVLLQEGELFGNKALSFQPLFLNSNNQLYASAYENAEADTMSLVSIDLNQKPLKPEPVLSLKGYDFSGNLILDEQRLLGVDYLTDARGSHWFDSQMKSWQEKVNELLPGTLNQLTCNNCKQAKQLVVTSYSDRQPPIYRLFNSQTSELTLLAPSRKWIQAQQMAARDMDHFPARDGMDIPVHITRPLEQKGPAPMVVLVHGGPYVRGGEWGWHSDSQFLASRGYVVIEPEFRGSTGFGRKLFQAGWKQWGLKMQDDIADATLWAVKQGYADAKRVCIAGASYGGYATLMGLIRYPELYRCGVNWVGVTDINLMYSINWSDSGEVWKTYGMPTLVGDAVKDAEQLEQTSPLKQAKKLTQPLLLAYGGEDRRVPIDHGTLLRRALEPHNHNVEWIFYSDEGHGWTQEVNKVDFWNRVEKFLDKNLKP
jgi:dienelactone hydrolase